MALFGRKKNPKPAQSLHVHVWGGPYDGTCLDIPLLPGPEDNIIMLAIGGAPVDYRLIRVLAPCGALIGAYAVAPNVNLGAVTL